MEPNEEIILLENKNMLLWLVREFSAETRENVISTGATALYRIQDTVRTRCARVLFCCFLLDSKIFVKTEINPHWFHLLVPPKYTHMANFGAKLSK